jgi:tRNA modification GTPase
MPLLLHPDDTIAALASPPGHAVRGIVRISGPATKAVLKAFFSPTDATAGKLGHSVPWCYPGSLRVAGLGTPLPVDLYLWPNHRSFTGQPLAEVHTISSPAVLEAILAEFLLRGVRPAQPGEFTLRAFLAGRIDLTQAEAVLGAIDAADERELETALDQLAGGLSSQIARLRGDLLNLLADLEAGLDFADEAIEFVTHGTLVDRLSLARDAVLDLLERAEARMRPAPRARVVLAGPPNAGKSTLFNSLAGAGSALVSNVAGTTRDYLTADLTIDNLALRLIDTAGHDSGARGIGVDAQRQRQQQIDEADLVIWCHSADQPVSEACDGHATVPAARILRLMTKSDLCQAEASGAGAALAVCAHTGAGLDELKAAVASRLSAPGAGARQLVGTTAARSQDSLRQARGALQRALAIAGDEADQELLAIEIREALEELGKIAGAVYTDDLLDRIFSRFCIGK